MEFKINVKLDCHYPLSDGERVILEKKTWEEVKAMEAEMESMIARDILEFADGYVINSFETEAKFK